MEALLGAMGKRQPEKDNTGFGTRCFMEFVLDGVDVVVIAGFAIEEGAGMHDCSFFPEQVEGFAALGDERIPLHSLTLWRRYYQLMQREDKVRMIDSAIVK